MKKHPSKTKSIKAVHDRRQNPKFQTELEQIIFISPEKMKISFLIRDTALRFIQLYRLPLLPQEQELIISAQDAVKYWIHRQTFKDLKKANALLSQSINNTEDYRIFDHMKPYSANLVTIISDGRTTLLDKMIKDHAFNALMDLFNQLSRVFVNILFGTVIRQWDYQDYLRLISHPPCVRNNEQQHFLRLFNLVAINFRDGGPSTDRWSAVTESLISAIPAPKRKIAKGLFQEKSRAETYNIILKIIIIGSINTLLAHLNLTNTDRPKYVTTFLQSALIILSLLKIFDHFEAKGFENLHCFKGYINYPQERFFDVMSRFKKEGWHFHRLLGRSILMENNSGDMLVIKIQKLGEQEQNISLINEYNSTLYLRKNATKFGLKSKIPEPMGVVKINAIPAWLMQQRAIDLKQLNTFNTMIDAQANKAHTAYIYQVRAADKGYFTYLHDSSLSTAQYQLANAHAVHDLFQLLMQDGMVFNRLADLFHNHQQQNEREDKGRYIVLTNLLRLLPCGSGRLTGWREGVEYPNLRATGLADLGDWVTSSEFCTYSDYVKTYHADSIRKLGEKTGNYLIANVMAEYQYVLFLIAGRRALSLSQEVKRKLAPEQVCSSFWKQAAAQTINNCALAVSLVTQQPIDKVSLMINGTIDAHRLARQMQFWMTDEYIRHIQNNTIPKDIYEDSARVDVNFDQIKAGTFHPHIGFSINGKTPDLGPVNGQEPIKEANKLFYLMITLIFHHYHLLTLPLKELHAMIKEKDTIQSEILRKKAFTYMPKQAYHRLQLSLCLERLASKQPLHETIKTAVIAEAKQHRQSVAALTIQGFWKKSQNRSNPHYMDLPTSGIELVSNVMN